MKNVYEVESILGERHFGMPGPKGRTYRITGWSEWSYSEGSDAIQVDDLGAVQVLHVTENYSEDASAGLVMTFAVTDAAGVVRHFQKHGYRQSHEGTYWDGQFEEVRPVQKWVTVYEIV